MTFADYQTRVAKLLQDAAASLASADRDDLIRQALQQRYSKDRPLESVTDVVADGTSFVPLPGTFEDGFSSVKMIEYPIGEVPISLVEAEEWQMYRSPSALKILLLETTPTNLEKLRVTWTARHNADGSTVYGGDFDAVCDYAASLSFEALAALKTQSGDPTILADAVNYRTKGQEYLALAKALRKRYFDHIGIEDSGAAGGVSAGPALAIGDMDLNMGSGVDRLTHRRPR